MEGDQAVAASASAHSGDGTTAGEERTTAAQRRVRRSRLRASTRRPSVPSAISRDAPERGVKRGAASVNGLEDSDLTVEEGEEEAAARLESLLAAARLTTNLLLLSADASHPINLRAIFTRFPAQEIFAASVYRRCYRLRETLCVQVCRGVRMDTLQQASREGRLDACVKAVRQMALQMASEAHLQKLLSVKMWGFLVTLIEDIADQLEADFPLFIDTIDPMWRAAVAELPSTTTAPTAPGSVHLPVFPPAIDPVQLVLQQSISTYHRSVEARLLPADGLMRLLELFRVDKGPIDTRGDSNTWDAVLDESVAADCALGEGEGPIRPGSFTVSGASGSLAALNGSYVIRPTEDEQATLVAPPDGALAFVGENVIFERLLYPTTEPVFDDESRVVWVAYEPATAQRPTPRLLAVGPGDADMPGGRLLFDPLLCSPAFETDEWYSVDEGKNELVEATLEMTATLPLDWLVPWSTLDKRTGRPYSVLILGTEQPVACRSLNDCTQHLAKREAGKGAAVRDLAFYLDAEVMQHLPPSARHTEQLTTTTTTTTTSSKRSPPLRVSDGEKEAVDRGCVRVSDEYVRKPFSQWPFMVLLKLMATGRPINGRRRGGSVCIVGADLRSFMCDVCGHESAEGYDLAGDQPLPYCCPIGDVMGAADFDYIREAGEGRLVVSDGRSRMCGPCYLKDKDSSVQELFPGFGPGDFVRFKQVGKSNVFERVGIGKTGSSSSTPASPGLFGSLPDPPREPPPAPSSIFRGIFTPKDKTTKPTAATPATPPTSTPTQGRPQPHSGTPYTPSSSSSSSSSADTVTVESIRSAFPDVATVRSATEGDKPPSKDTLSTVKKFLEPKAEEGAAEGGGESSECDGAQERETYLRAVKKFFMDHRTALQSDPSAVFALGPLRHVRGEWLPQWHTTFVSELSKGQQLMQKELGAATRGPTDANNASAFTFPADDTDDMDQLRADLSSALRGRLHQMGLSEADINDGLAKISEEVAKAEADDRAEEADKPAAKGKGSRRMPAAKSKSKAAKKTGKPPGSSAEQTPAPSAAAAPKNIKDQLRAGADIVTATAAAIKDDRRQMKADMMSITAALRRHPSSRLFREPYTHPEYTHMYPEDAVHCISHLETMVPDFAKRFDGWFRWLGYIEDMALNARNFTKAGSDVFVAAGELYEAACRLVERDESSTSPAVGSRDDIDDRSELTTDELYEAWDSCRLDRYLPCLEALVASVTGPFKSTKRDATSGEDATTSGLDGPAPSASSAEAATETEVVERYKAFNVTEEHLKHKSLEEARWDTYDKDQQTEEALANISRFSSLCSNLQTNIEHFSTTFGAREKEMDQLNQTVKRQESEIKRLSEQLEAANEQLEAANERHKEETKAADAQRSTLEDLLKDRDKQIKKAQKTADDRVRRVSQQVREEADKAAKTHIDIITKQHREELDALRGEHRSAILELRAQHRTAIEQRESEVRGEAERAMADVTRERDQLRQRLREERLRSARVDQEKDVELRRLREAEAPLRRENLMLKQQLSAQPPHSRVTAEGVSSLDLPSVGEQHRLAQLHQAAIERQIELRPYASASSSSSSSAAAAAAVPFSRQMDNPSSSSAAQANARCAAPAAAAAAAAASGDGGGAGPQASNCSLCLVNPTNVVLMPCGHKVVCQECFEKWMAPMPTADKLCPEHTCRQPYFEVKYVFD
ncbi:unnamed protein product [Vitrella brassicaformis CCMP3155]|uniref:RING-type domain-containing protein n=5 Tax=Vitrella brassicaformis TaxID=1169539 RepID=A0A0G4EV84_VITBC|nr:unnamed protein product [Vitrella brassicaformis CCMP3155]|eukprot:CEM01974.1 unnamed protein product [Vitrella brassicaformis CCMP3155]